MPTTEVANLVAKLTLDASEFNKTASSLSSSGTKNLKKGVEDAELALRGERDLEEAERLAAENAQADLQLQLLDTGLAFQRILGNVLASSVYTAGGCRSGCLVWQSQERGLPAYH